jgi:hypothetical protein
MINTPGIYQVGKGIFVALGADNHLGELNSCEFFTSGNIVVVPPDSKYLFSCVREGYIQPINSDDEEKPWVHGKLKSQHEVLLGYIEVLALRLVEDRIIAFLRWWVKNHSPNSNPTNFPDWHSIPDFTHQEVSNFVRSSRVTISRSYVLLEERKILFVKNRRERKLWGR